ncbi:MAG TPA: hypothetical protein PKC65_13330 [Pyrinomonadaceae bacterium]|nr:hypothetical protein [Pyrinomonadaceae bacterium]
MHDLAVAKATGGGQTAAANARMKSESGAVATGQLCQNREQQRPGS